ncbi:hypothetical protein [Clavibacter nebraskensis]|uniref:hypothetical protein n=1 Tax=Clavibacter nebraskensis TaxID=31963 RepID=UPI00200D205B|nr:hypothetical protein [Clavibacter nebraskensis]UQB14587.1 hypothetical protein LIX20_001209 [Clavibacter nebraskensis]UQB17419.1 hypothetical protein LIX22_001208 [Clavibacter nebraskensis]
MNENRVGRPCTICASPHRAAIEGAAIDGERISRIARAFEVYPDAVRRHLYAHVDLKVKEALRTVEGLSPAVVIMRVQEVANSARDLRDAALDKGNIAAALRAGDAELRALTALAERFGITSDTVARDLQAADDVAVAVASTAIKSHEAGLLLADALEQLDHRVFAETLRASISRNKELR